MLINIILILLVIMLTAIPLIMKSGSEFTGSDDLAEKAIYDMQADYKPWATPLWKPSKDVEALLFNLQVAIGAGVIGYYIGRKSKKREE